MLIHEFVLADKIISYKQIKDYYHVSINDDIILYMKDSFAWIPTFWNSFDNKKISLNYYGVTIFRDEGIAVLKSIMSAWKQLFANAPNHFAITGSYTSIEGEEISSGKYEKIQIKKENIIQMLTKMINLCEQAINEKVFIIHFGI